MAKHTFNVQIECEVVTFDEAIAQAQKEGDIDQERWIRENASFYPMPLSVNKVICDGQPAKDEGEDYMEHRHLLAGTGGDGYTLSVTHYIV